MDYDVAVVGGGPTGLALAGELALHGARAVVLERQDEPDDTVKAGSVNAATAAWLRQRGLFAEVDQVQEAMLAQIAALHGHTPQQVRAGMRRRAGHFAGLFLIDPSRLPADDPDLAATDGSTLVPLAQVDLERVLERFAEARGAEVRRGVGVTGFSAGDDGVAVRTAWGLVRTRYLVGCDGGRSAVRRWAGFDFPGTDPTLTLRQAIVDLDHPERLAVGWVRTPAGLVVHGPQPRRVLTVEFDGPPADRAAPVTAAEVEASLRRVSGADVRVTALHSATRSTDNARQVTTYRRGRVLLAGDAAHVHSPFGGQGLNLGLGDAANLGWKLAAVATGRAEEALLDTYTAERHPVGARVLRVTRAQIAVLRPGPEGDALREVVTDLMRTDDGNAHFVKLMGGLLNGYDLGGTHPAVGKLLPLLDLADGSTTADHLREGGAVLFDLNDSAAVRAAAGGRVRVVSGKAAVEAPDMLVRPDGHVAWAGTDATGLDEAIQRWCF
ncbi:FAD-dependent oxidoreductase [Actinokineospora bangkokensis]|uniref:FAD-binding domain-containing protein n=1 Tax=Actinokineospora bangkokensis TaxID=1193682 RepID=A0A1Q9LMT5_9PSEU|nr:FAD-dependent oxidoreductase [Actinokineospora bangkokensis]OLR93325.1 hypothetical protein BJP25_17785 [Actinokineospora bangkokensis]